MVFTERYQICHDQPCAWAYSGGTNWAPVYAYTDFGKFQPQPPQDRCNPDLAQSQHAGVINVGMGDGSVRAISNNISQRTWYEACTPAGGEVLGSDF
jgi:prepilin-type processing-associated H-X9-DG protein